MIAISDPDDSEEETPEETIDRLTQERDDAIADRDRVQSDLDDTNVELQNERDKNKVLENQIERDENEDTVERILTAIDSVLQTPLAPVYDAGKEALEALSGRCDNCGQFGVQPREHNYSCKAKHSWWSCDEGDYKWQHGHCCPDGQVWTDEFGCVQPGYSPPPKPWYGSGSGSSSSSSYDPG